MGPELLFPYIREHIRRGLYAKAYEVLTPETRRHLSYEEFFFALSGFEPLRRLMTGAEVHALKQEDDNLGWMKLCNPEFGVSEEFGFEKILGGRLWGLGIQEKQRELFRKKAYRWWRLQYEAADKKFYVYPRDWRYKPLMPYCDCKR